MGFPRLVQELGAGVEEVMRMLVALVDQRVMWLPRLNRGVALVERCPARAVVPQRGAGRADVGLELSGTGISPRSGNNGSSRLALDVIPTL